MLSFVLVFLGVTLNVYISGVPLLHPYRVMQFTILFLAIAGWITPRLTVHRWIATVVLGVLFTGQILFRLLPGLSGI